uniref:Cucumisin n=1 Tax=Quercus lobata TaxID=97700 RepID=A0A7N2RA00_QUELO
MKIKKMLGHKTLRYTYTATFSRERDELGQNFVSEAGNVVSGASLLGLRTRTAREGVPFALIVVYKICWSDGCFAADILVAFDDAINDGVDIISLSIRGFSPLDYFKDSIAIGAFHAMRNGIFTSSFAGNSGPSPATITNFSPRSLLVAASTIERKVCGKCEVG